MSEQFNLKFERLSLAKWGERGSLIMPGALCRAWGHVQLPDWAVADLDLVDGNKIEDLFSCEWPAELFKRTRIENYLSRMLRLRLDTVHDDRIIPGEWPSGLDPSVLPFATRTKNRIRDAGLPESGPELIELTYGDLMSIPGMGPRSVLDMATTLETAMYVYRSAGALSPGSDSDAGIDRPGILTEVYSLAEGLEIDEISSRDPRFRDVMPLGTGTLADRLEQICMAAEPEVFAREAYELRLAIPKIQSRASEISSMQLDEALRDLFRQLSNLKGRRFDALISRFGWDGSPPVTLEAAGQRLEVTRERVRQIQKKIYAKFPEHPLYLPQLRTAIAKLDNFVPAKIDVAGLYLRTEGVTEKSFDPRSVIAAASDCGIECPIRVQTVRGVSLVVSKKQKAAAEALMKYARKQAGASGATNVSELMEQVQIEGFEVTEKKALRLLRAHKKVSFLSDDWFWFPGITVARNRLRNQARKMLAVTSPLAIADIRGGLRRVYTFRNSTGTARSWPLRVPPTNVLTEFFRQHPEFSVDDQGRACSAETLDYRKELGPADQVFVDALRSTSSSVLDRQSLLRECRNRGLNDNSFSVITTYSPILSHVDLNIWTLRGVDVNPAAVEALRAANALRPREKRLQDFGWTTDGNIWIATRVPELYESYICGCPGAVVRFLKGRKFRAVGEDGLEYGTIAFTDGQGTSYGYNPFLQRVGAEHGDILVAEFDLTDCTVKLRIGDLELLDAMDLGQ